MQSKEEKTYNPDNLLVSPPFDLARVLIMSAGEYTVLTVSLNKIFHGDKGNPWKCENSYPRENLNDLKYLRLIFFAQDIFVCCVLNV